MVKRNKSNNSGGGQLKPISGFVRLRGLEVGATIAGTYKAVKTFGEEYPKDYHIIELAQGLTYKTKEGSTTVKAGDVVAVETVTALSKELSQSDAGKPITIIYKGQSANKKPGQRPAFLVDIYDGLPEGVSVSSAPAATKAPGKRSFPTNAA